MSDKNNKPLLYWGHIVLSKRYQLSLAIVVLLLFIVAQSAFAAKFFVYQLPDGSRVISDRPIHKATHKLVTSRRKLEGTGQIAAKRYQKKPKPSYQYDDLITEVAHRHSVDVALIKAVVHTESYFNTKAKSHAGATGLMQLMPKTAAKYGVYDRTDPIANLEAGVKHLRYLIGKYPNNLKYALAAYNAGEGAVYYYNGIPPYEETQNYVQKVLNYRDYYKDTL
jgi:soluble lytic murein transglycosylase-like protein